MENLTFEEKISELDQKARQQQLEEEKKLEELKRKNHDFVQFNRGGLEKLALLSNALAVQVFLFLSKEMDVEAKIVISQTTLAEIFKVRRETINIAIKDLVKAELLFILKSGNTSIYCLNAYVVWSQSRDKIETAKFKSMVIISKKEQVELKKTRLKQISLKDKKGEEK